MFCEHCHGRAANVHLVKIINGERSELHLCSACAKKERFNETENLLNHSMNSILRKRLFNILPYYIYRNNNGSPRPVKQADFDGLNLSNGIFCRDQDYKSFREELRPLFSHNLTPNEPGLKEESIKDEKLAEYEKQLKSAINSEDFEQAAKLRDQIQAYKAQNGI
jgi:protein arginine kinase activator